MIELDWRNYIESDEFSSKALFDADLQESEGVTVLLSTPDLTLYATDLYPKSRFLVAIGNLESAVKSLPLDLERTVFIKLKLPNIKGPDLEKIFDSYDIQYLENNKTPSSTLNLIPLENVEEIVDLYVGNHSHHVETNRTLLTKRVKEYGLQKLRGDGFTIYLEGQAESYETSFFCTNGTDVGKRALSNQLKELGSFEMELDSTLSEFELLKADLAEYCKYSCSLYKILSMTSTLPGKALRTGLGTHSLTLPSGEEVVVRPLEATDILKLNVFLKGLSEQTRNFILPPNSPLPTATKLCEEIDKGEKLRFVVEDIEGSILALLEFSLKIPSGDSERFKTAGYDLDENIDCRFGPTIADNYQNTGLGGKLFPCVVDIARKLGKKRIILWDGVLKENKRAVHYFEKNGFKLVGSFIDDGDEMIDMILEIK